MLIDTHCHLDAREFDKDRSDLVAAANRAGVAEIVVPGVSAADFARLRDCCRAYAGCHPAYGLHPLYVREAAPEDLDVLRDWLVSEHPVAVGEIGLDCYLPDLDLPRQEFFFVQQLKLAREFSLPVILHVRRAVDHVLKHLRRIEVPGGIAHAFNGSRQQAETFLALGFKLGFGGSMTYAGSTRIRTLAATLPLDAIVLETDAPDIPPAWLDRGRNTPQELTGIATEFARLRGMDLQEAAVACSANARSVLPRMG
ncbi:MAG TPA: TatD family hydrolase [Rhodocyclaceae bacterium]|jgi:TatD DNase family protein|nr:TatD family hydrolase [Betaproteobacteria bacterium]HMU99892.1 TatD family hydrolase [Rhodocyclaceae bacterium]HNL20384.1 TatD family hydrolase [Rhodocyclaceae bacterium]HNM22059.1 TatD family hydrolase [Rhodocyclaceae bacterium]HNM80635.1 TatD family hydrolase [Rhodocyclaceae bacterium]